MEAFATVLGKLQGLKKIGPGSWKARCPGHDDVNPSLGVKIGTSGVLMFRCYAGCETEKILQAMQLTFADLRPEGDRAKQTQRRIVATYPYRDEHGNVLCEAVRYEPKEFRQRQPNPNFDPGAARGPGNEEWTWNTEGVRKTPYRLPELRKAWEVKPDRVVHVVEGEKDADLLWSIGYLATCNIAGALKWTSEHAQHLAGRRVVVIPDEDLRNAKTDEIVGLAHARLVRSTLVGVASSVRIVRLPCEAGQKQDVASFIESWGPIGVEERAKRWRDFVTERLSRSALEEVSARIRGDQLRKEEALWMSMQAIARFMTAVSNDVKREECIEAAANLLVLADLLE